MAREPLALKLADGRRWAELMGEARARSESTDAHELDLIGRRALAEERRVRHPDLRTWAPGDPQPSPLPEHGVFDLDGCVWLHQGASGCWRMAAADRRRYADSSHDYEGERPWFYLAESEGPLTERPAPRKQRLSSGLSEERKPQ